MCTKVRLHALPGHSTSPTPITFKIPSLARGSFAHPAGIAELQNFFLRDQIIPTQALGQIHLCPFPASVQHEVWQKGATDEMSVE